MGALLPIPILSIFLVPALSSYLTSFNLIFFYFTWSTLVLSHPPLRVELFGTATIRLLFFTLPSLVFFLFDNLAPSAAVVVKAQGESGLPNGGKRTRIRVKELKVAGWSLLNICLGVAAQAAIESLVLRELGMRSAIKVSMKLPMPWDMVKDLFYGFLMREVRSLFILIVYVNYRKLLTSVLDFGLRLAPLRPSLGDVSPDKIPHILVPCSQGSIPINSALRPPARILSGQVSADLFTGHALPFPHAHLSLIFVCDFHRRALRVLGLHRHADQLLPGWHFSSHR